MFCVFTDLSDNVEDISSGSTANGYGMGPLACIVTSYVASNGWISPSKVSLVYAECYININSSSRGEPNWVTKNLLLDCTDDEVLYMIAFYVCKLQKYNIHFWAVTEV